REQPGEVERGRLALEVRVGAEDHLGDALGTDPRDQLADPQLLGAHALEVVDRSLQHVVAAAVLAGALHRDDVAGLLHHAQDVGVTPGIRADAAQLALGDVEALAAEADLLLHLDDRPGEAVRLLRVHLEQVEGDALGRLRPDARQPAERVDELLDGDRVGRRHQPPPPSRPPSASGSMPSPPSGFEAACSSATWSCASCHAALMRSSRMVGSSGSTAPGSMRTRTRWRCPFSTTSTSPPPAVPVTSLEASCSWASTMRLCMSAAICIIEPRANPPPGTS